MQITQITFAIADTGELADFTENSVLTLSTRDEHNEHLFEPGDQFCTDIDDDDYRFFATIEDALEHVAAYIKDAAVAAQRAS